MWDSLSLLQRSLYIDIGASNISYFLYIHVPLEIFLIRAVLKFKRLAIKERLLEVDQRILQEEQERKMAKIKKVELQSSRSTQESFSN